MTLEYDHWKQVAVGWKPKMCFSVRRRHRQAKNGGSSTFLN